jgi:flagellar basal body-associated protein FliL
MKIKFIILALAVLSLTACASVSKSVQKTETEAKTKKEETTTSTTTTTESIDTTVNVAGQTLEASTPVQPLIDGDTLHKETPEGSITAYVDRATGRLNIKAETKPREVPVQMNRTTTTQAKTTTKEQSSQKAKETFKEKQGPRTWCWILSIIILGAAAIGCVLFAHKQIRHN